MNLRPHIFVIAFSFFSIVGNAQSIAFPTAEGFGKYTKGGRGGEIIKVTNLNDDGPGSFRAASTKKSTRIILFEVSGTIHLQSKINIQGNVTIAGQSAPGDGICIADQSIILGGDNIIVRYMRFRLGDKFQKGGMIDGNGGDDALGGNKHKNIIIDHCSMSWSNDEVFSIYGGDSTTLQWNMIAEPLNYSYHFEKGDADVRGAKIDDPLRKYCHHPHPREVEKEGITSSRSIDAKSKSAEFVSDPAATQAVKERVSKGVRN